MIVANCVTFIYISFMIKITRKIEFDAAHRIIGHHGKCKNLHGHRYVLEVVMGFAELDELGFAIDFAIISERLGKWVNENWDHNVILWDADAKLGDGISDQTGQKIFFMDCNPSAENMALFIKERIIPQLFADQKIVDLQVKLSETPNCYVIV